MVEVTEQVEAVSRRVGRTTTSGREHHVLTITQDLSLLGLALHLAPGGAEDPAEAAAWAGEEDGLLFLHLSGEAWHDAEVAAGTDPREARLRADRTIGAYTAPQDDED